MTIVDNLSRCSKLLHPWLLPQNTAPFSLAVTTFIELSQCIFGLQQTITGLQLQTQRTPVPGTLKRICLQCQNAHRVLITSLDKCQKYTKGQDMFTTVFGLLFIFSLKSQFQKAKYQKWVNFGLNSFGLLDSIWLFVLLPLSASTFVCLTKSFITLSSGCDYADANKMTLC